jgi:hypothetical protein
MADRKMHQTTVRFGADLWEALEAECARLGVSVAQFVRESALARLMYMAGRRGEPAHDTAFELASAPLEQAEVPALSSPLTDLGTAASMRERSEEERSASSALWAQGQQARRKAQQLRDQSERRRHAR